MKSNKWETVESEYSHSTTSRMKVPGGWLIRVSEYVISVGVSVSVTFFPDPKHKWKV